MAKYRYINTKFWSDNFISDLNPLDRYLFLYFLTNEHTNICGVYEIPLRTISFETGIEIDMVKKMIARLSGKVFYIDGWIYIKNFIKHQSSDSKTVKIGINNAFEVIPENIRLKIKELDTLSIGYGYGLGTYHILEPESELESKLELEPELERGDTPSQEAKSFFSGGKIYNSLLLDFSDGNDRNLIENEFKKFVLYWTEKNKSGTKQRWEQQNTFEVKRRLYTWMSRMKEFNKVEKNPKIVLFS